jgi:hypothetical protein
MSISCEIISLSSSQQLPLESTHAYKASANTFAVYSCTLPSGNSTSCTVESKIGLGLYRPIGLPALSHFLPSTFTMNWKSPLGKMTSAEVRLW